MVESLLNDRYTLDPNRFAELLLNAIRCKKLFQAADAAVLPSFEVYLQVAFRVFKLLS